MHGLVICKLGVHRVVWNNGMNWGLCRVVLWGRWFEDKPPYGEAEGVRMEDEDALDVDSDQSKHKFGCCR